MCGIVGVATCQPQSDRDWLTISRETLIHRGPDDAGLWWSNDQRVGLAHRRLSIVDLSSAGHQPMHDRSGELTVVYNGEIYNHLDLRSELEALGHRFRSNSDTEVLLAAYLEWGDEFLDRLNGMFALALFDARHQRLFLARDRAGEKPLFYYHAIGQGLYFASELKALMANPTLPRQLDPLSLDCYLSMGYVPGERCILKGFHKLPPAHAMTFDLRQGVIKIWRYWCLPDVTPDADEQNDEDLLLELETLLEDAVGRQLMADVPVGVLLSGGVDSSLVTAMAIRRSRKIQTFSIRFPGHELYDETEHARLIARHFGTHHTELTAEPGTADLIPRLARQFDEPLIDSSMIPTYLVSHLVRQHCTVALGGDGGDELFGGYGHYNRLLIMQGTAAWCPSLARRIASVVATRCLPIGFKGRNWMQALGLDLTTNLPLIANYFDVESRRRLLNGTGPTATSSEAIFADRVPKTMDLLQRATRMDFCNYMPEDILVKVDRASMLNSLEVRAPLLDHRLIEFAFGRVPTRLKTTTSERKILLKRLCERLLPPEFDRQRKQGFGVPLRTWLKAGPFRELFWGLLLDRKTIFDHSMLQSLLDGLDQGRGNSERLFGLVVFELWRREYRVGL